MKKVEILFELMKSGKLVLVEDMVSKLDVKIGAVMCMICTLRNDLGAKIETVRDGRQVVTYQLMNANDVKAPTKKTPKTAKVPKAPKTPKVPKGEKSLTVTSIKSTVSRKPVKVVEVKDETPTLEILEIDSDAELESLKAELGLTESYAE